jgi:hypothetical protein
MINQPEKLPGTFSDLFESRRVRYGLDVGGVRNDLCHERAQIICYRVGGGENRKLKN